MTTPAIQSSLASSQEQGASMKPLDEQESRKILKQTAEYLKTGSLENSHNMIVLLRHVRNRAQLQQLKEFLHDHHAAIHRFLAPFGMPDVSEQGVISQEALLTDFDRALGNWEKMTLSERERAREAMIQAAQTVIVPVPKRQGY